MPFLQVEGAPLYYEEAGTGPVLVLLHGLGASLQDCEAEITMAFTADFTGGDTARTVTDVWTFGRRVDAADPNWTLVATGGDLPG